MNRILRVLTLLLLLSPFVGLAQNGKLSGTITDEATKEPVPFASVRVFSGGQFKGGGVADINGRYEVAPLAPGTYKVEYSFTGYQPRIINDLNINADRTTRHNVALSTKLLNEVVIETYEKKLIDEDGGVVNTITAKDIKNIPSRDVNTIIASTPDAFSNEDGGALNVRGISGSSNITYVNGRRVLGTNLPPVEAISSISVFTGGVPAQYGDALGGVITITTKGAAENYRAGIQLESSSLFDTYHYNLIGANFSGPLIRRRVTNPEFKGDTIRTLLGVYAAYTFQYEADRDPSAYGYKIAKDDVQSRLETTPLRRFEDEQGNPLYRSQADFLNPSDFKNIQARPNSASRASQFNVTFDYQPSNNILISFGGDLNSSSARNINYGGLGQRAGTSNFNWFNSANNNQGSEDEYAGFVRFKQSFPNLASDSGFGLRNFYYQLQADYSRTYRLGQDPRYKERQELYNYWGKFRERRSSVLANDVVEDNGKFYFYQPGTSRIVDSITVGNSATGVPPNGTVYRIEGNTITQGIPGGFTYEPFADAGVATNINRQILSSEEASGAISTFNQLPRFGGLINGQGTSIGAGYGFFNFPGELQSGYGWQNNETYRASGIVSGEIGNHTLKVGFEYEQRVNATYGGGQSPWLAARRLVNNHIISNLNRGTSLSSLTTSFTPAGTRVVTINPDLAVNTDEDGNILNQTAYDRRLRQILGVPNNQLINVEELDPSLVNVKNFTTDELLGDGLNITTAYQGVNAYGERLSKRPTFFDFFTDTINRPIDAFRPTYYAGYIEDKYEVQDFIFRAGLRIDQFDINQPVLRDKYSLTRLTLAGETDLSKFDNGNFRTPSNIGSDYAVYVDKTSDDDPINNPGNFKVVGFRDGTQFYNAQGQEISDSRILFPDNNIFPLYDVTRLSPSERVLQRSRGITTDAFRDFKPQTNFMPRLSFSFPISETAQFYAYYDILTQRPQGTAGNGRSGPITFDNYASPLQYFNLSRISGNPFLNNPDLLPQRKIDYQIGFQQALTKRSALKISAFYSEIKDLIQVTNVLGGFPNPSYRTNSNIDFGVVKGMTMSYDLRKVKGVGLSAGLSYTLQFAEGSASDFAQQLLNTSTPNLRNIAPQNWDQRHTFKLNIDYRTGDKAGPSIAGSHIFSNAGINMTNFAGSGQPYTKDGSVWGGRSQVEGSINGARLPFNNRTNIRIDKTWYFKTGFVSSEESSINVYIYVQNVFDQMNILNVYRRTGRADDDGYLASDFGQNQISQGEIANFSAETYAYYYRQLLFNPDFVSAPRRFRIGLQYNF